MNLTQNKRVKIGIISLALVALIAITTVLTALTPAQAAPSSTVIYLGGERIKHAMPVTADLNGNGYKEIVVGTNDGILHVIAYNGSIWSVVWSRQTALDINAAGPPNPQSNSRIESAIAIADLNNDGDLEIVVTTGGLPQDRINGGVLVYGYQTDSPWSFAIEGDWPQPKMDRVGAGGGASNPDGYWDGIYNSPAIGDLDGDGDLEIVVEGEDRAIHVWEHTGAYAPNWPYSNLNGDVIYRGGISSPALGDIDNDGLPEIVVGGNNPKDLDFSYARIWALNGDKTHVPGWPQHIQQWVDSSPALGDIDNDGELEVVVGTGRPGIGGTAGHNIYAWNSDGSPVTGWPRPTGANMASSPALADLDGDGGLDVIIGCGHESDLSCKYLYAWHGDGSNVPGFPALPVDTKPDVWADSRQPHSQPYPPVVADIDTDGQLEIITAMSQSPGLSIINHDGTQKDDYTHNQEGYEVILSSPLVDDVDNDGLLEIVHAGDANGQAAIYIWDETGSADNDLPWPMFHQNIERTGLFPQTADIGGTITQLNDAPLAGVTVSLSNGSTMDTQADGSYLFSEIEPGDYVITPTLSGYSFLPPTQTVNIPPDASNIDFSVAYYNISGQVVGSNGLPLANVTVLSNNGLNDTTDANGIYSFENLLLGTYNITPTFNGNYTISPPNRTVTLPPDAVDQNFNILPNPVSGNATPGQGITLSYTDTQGLVSNVIIPTGAVTQATTLVLTPTSPSGQALFSVIGGSLQPGNTRFTIAGHSFMLKAYVGGTLQTDFSFSQPISLSIEYSDSDTKVISNKEHLFVLRWTGSGWQDVAETCNPASTYQRDLANKTIQVSICHLTQMGLFGPTQSVYLPLILR